MSKSMPSRSSSATVTPQTQVAKAKDPVSLLKLYRPDLSAMLEKRYVPAYRHAQVLEHLLRRPGAPLGEASTLPADLRSELQTRGHGVMSLLASTIATDGTTKFLLAARDGAEVETVLMPYRDRLTVCVSSQVGCPVGCLFCATGSLGFRRNLTVAEIVDQVRLASETAARQGKRVSNVVYMGMGEPLLNLGAVLGSIALLTYPRGLGLAHRALSVSTVGIPASIRRLGRVEPQVNLALSLHGATDETRALLIPPEHRHGIREVIAAARDHFALTRRKLLVEYVLLRGINDSPEDARQLAALLRGMVVAVNLLVWNRGPVQTVGTARSARRGGFPKESREHPHWRPTATAESDSVRSRATNRVGTPANRAQRRFEPSPSTAVRAFADVLRAARIETVARRSKGTEISAACGQLAADHRTYAHLE